MFAIFSADQHYTQTLASFSCTVVTNIIATTLYSAKRICERESTPESVAISNIFVAQQQGREPALPHT